jgi:hypothetical protein
MVRVGRSRSILIGCVMVTLAATGCGGPRTLKTPPSTVQRDVAGRFAAALLRGDATGAHALLVPGGDGALVFLVQQALAPWTAPQWKARRASIQLPARRTGSYWTVSFVRRQTKSDGSFERQRGDLVISVSPSAVGARVSFFTFQNLRTRFSTHRDSQLLPSKR